MAGVVIGLVLIGYVAWCWYFVDTLTSWGRPRPHAYADFHRTDAGTHGNGHSDQRTDSGSNGHGHGNRATHRAAGRDPRRRAIRRFDYGPSAARPARGRASYIPDA